MSKLTDKIELLESLAARTRGTGAELVSKYVSEIRDAVQEMEQEMCVLRTDVRELEGLLTLNEHSRMDTEATMETAIRQAKREAYEHALTLATFAPMTVQEKVEHDAVGRAAIRAESQTGDLVRARLQAAIDALDTEEE